MKLERDEWARVLALLDTALDLPAPARAPWLQALVLEPPHLKAALQRLLQDRHAIETEDFLGLGAESSLLGVGTVLGPWRLLRELGQGGMASVWLAEKADGTHLRQVALKLPHAVFGSNVIAERFERERHILSTLQHPHIAQVLDAGVQGSQPWLALEYVEGQPITRHAAEQGLGVQARLQLFLPVVQAVQHAHGQLIIHRDIKPANVLVTADGTVKLLDFGVAKLLESDGATFETALTKLGGRAMTPQYASPEQVAGRPLGVASDVYSLGVLLYELLTGQLPYRLQRSTPAALEEAILAAQVQRPSQAAAAAGEPRKARALRGDVDTIVMKALAAEPARRYPSAAALANDIERYLKALPITARPASIGYRLRKLWQRQRLVLSASAIGAALLLLGAGSTLWQARLAQAQGERAAATQQFLVGLFDNSARTGSGNKPAYAVTGQELLATGTQRLLTEHREPTPLRLELLTMLGNLSAELDLLEPGRALLDEAVPLSRQLYGENDAHYAEALLNAAELKTRAADIDAALAQGRLALQAFGRVRRPAPVLLSQTHLLLGNVLDQMHRFDESRTELEAAAALLPQVAPGHLLQSRVRFYLARAYEAQGEFPKAETLYREGIQAAENSTGAQSYMAAFGYQNYGDLLRLMGRHDEAQAQLKRAISVYDKVLGPKNLSTSSAYFYLGLALEAQGQRQQADAAYVQAIALADEVNGGFKVGYAGGLVGARAAMLLDMGRLDAAREQIELLLKAAGPGDPVRQRSIQKWGLWLARIKLLQGDGPAARAWLQEAKAAVAPLPAADPAYGVTRCRLIAASADLAAAEGDVAGARSMLWAALRKPPPLIAGDLAGPLDLAQSLSRLPLAPDEARQALALFAQLGDEPQLARRSASNQARLDITVGRLLLQAGDATAAQPRLERAVALRQQIDSPNSVWLADAQLAWADGWLQRHQPARARPLLDQARAILATQPQVKAWAPALAALQRKAL